MIKRTLEFIIVYCLSLAMLSALRYYISFEHAIFIGIAFIMAKVLQIHGDLK